MLGGRQTLRDAVARTLSAEAKVRKNASAGVRQANWNLAIAFL